MLSRRLLLFVLLAGVVAAGVALAAVGMISQARGVRPSAPPASGQAPITVSDSRSAHAPDQTLGVRRRTLPQQSQRLEKPKTVQLVVHLKRPAPALLRRLGARTVKSIPQIRVTVVSVPVKQATQVLRELRASHSVAYAAKDGLSHASNYYPNDPYFNSTYYGTTSCENSLYCWPYNSLRLAQAWDVTQGSSVIVAVVDTGVDATQPDLSGAVLAGYNEITQTTNSADDYGHGTEVAGVIAARINNGIGIAGVCGSCQILPVKVLDSTGTGYNSNIAAGITWAADHGAKIINLSLAGTTADSSILSAINYAIGKGVLVVAAAGNAGSTDPTVAPGGYPGYDTTQISSGLIAVGATNYWDDLYSFSNYGSWVTVAAPGCTVGTQMGGTYATGGVCGTSFASPFTAGVAALALSYNSSLTPAQIQSAITGSVRTVSGLNVKYGGVVNAYATLQSLGAVLTAPANTSAPVISGTAQQDKTLSASSGTWSGSPTINYSYQWSRCDAQGANCVPISGATTTSYTVLSTDIGGRLQVTVTAVNAAGSASIAVLTSVVIGCPPTNTAAPVLSGGSGVSGAPSVGDTLTVSDGTWSGTTPISYSYTWSRCDSSGANCVPVNGATVNNYAVVSSDAGDTLEATVTATNSWGSVLASSLSSVVVVTPPVNTAAPTISGGSTPVVGNILAAQNGTWTGSPTIAYSYDWQRCDSSGANCTSLGRTASSYTTVSSDLGHTIRLVVTATNFDGSSSASALSAAVAGPPVLAASPTISGTAQDGQTLTVSSGTWSGYPAPTYSFQWNRCDTSGANCVAITGATASDYTATAPDVSHKLQATVTATNSAGSVSAVALSDVVVGLPPSNISLPTILGTVQDGQTLTIGAGTWSGSAPLTYSYTWARCDIQGANCSATVGVTSSYTLSTADVGQTLQVVVTATNSAASTSVGVLSGIVTAVLPSNTSAPAVIGGTSPVVGDTLVASAGTWSGSSPLSYSYQWQSSTDGQSWADIAAATSTSYVVDSAYVGKLLRVMVTTANSVGSASVPSPATGQVALAGGGGNGGGSGGGGGGGSSLPPDIRLVGTAPKSANLGDTISYDFEVSSLNAGSATNLVLTGSFPGATFVSGSSTRGAGCTGSSSAVRCSLDWLSSPLVANIRIVVVAATAGEQQASFTVSESETDVNLANNQVTLTTAVAQPGGGGNGGGNGGGGSGVLDNRVPPAVTGSAKVGQLLRASLGKWQGAKRTVLYWSRCDRHGQRCARIWAAGKRPSYRLTKADRGHRIEVVVFASDGKKWLKAPSKLTAIVR